MMMMMQVQHQLYCQIKNYLCETSPVMTTEVVDMTFLPATSTTSQTLHAYIHKEHTLRGRTLKHGIVFTSGRWKHKYHIPKYLVVPIFQGLVLSSEISTLKLTLYRSAFIFQLLYIQCIILILHVKEVFISVSSRKIVIKFGCRVQIANT